MVNKYKYRWYFWLESGCRKEEYFDKSSLACIVHECRTPPDDDDSPYYATAVVSDWLERNTDMDYEDGDYQIVYVEDEVGRRFKVEAHVRVEVEWNCEGSVIEPESKKETLEELGQQPLLDLD